MHNLAIFANSGDLHAHAIKHRLRSRRDVNVELFSTDSVIFDGGINWENERRNAFLSSLSGKRFRPEELDVIWWRRVNQGMNFPEWLADPVEREFVTNEWRAALVGLLNNDFRGVWVNNPAHDLRAGNKLWQLRLAQIAGFVTPRTLISQQPEEIRSFCAELGGEIVAKKLAGGCHLNTASVLVREGDLTDDESIKLCPVIYQQVVRSNRHLRVNCFGQDIHAFLIESPVFDWRTNLIVRFIPYRLDDDVRRKLTNLLELAELEMGIMDMMFDRDGELVWIELNPQGQFLFCEALSGYDLMTPFADFLLAKIPVASDSAENAIPFCVSQAT